jgi:hypothetical protein
VRGKPRLVRFIKLLAEGTIRFLRLLLRAFVFLRQASAAVVLIDLDVVH